MKFRLKKNGAHLAGGAALFCLTALALLPLERMWVRMLGALAAAAAIWEYFMHNGIQIFADYRYCPNQLVFNTLYDALCTQNSETRVIK